VAMRKPPHITATIEQETRPQFTYKPNPYNPLRIDVCNAEGETLSAVTLVRGSRETLLKQLREQEQQRNRGLGK
jgi:hypothetical protein